MISSAPCIHHPHTIMIMMYRIYTAAFIRTTTITYILQRFMTTIVPVIHYCGRQKVSNSKEKRMNCKRRVGFSGRELVVLFFVISHHFFSHVTG